MIAPGCEDEGEDSAKLESSINARVLKLHCIQTIFFVTGIIFADPSPKEFVRIALTQLDPIIHCFTQLLFATHIPFSGLH